MSDGSVSQSSEPPEDLRLCELVRSSSQPIGLLELPDGGTLEVSDAFTTLVGRSRDECLGLTVRDYSDDPEGAQASLALLAAGTIDSYTRRVRLTPSRGEEPHRIGVHVSAWAVIGPRRHALATLLPNYEYPRGSSGASRTAHPGVVVVGTMGPEWRIDRVTSDAEGLLGYSPQELLGQSALTIVDSQDAGVLVLLAAHSAARAGGASAQVRLRPRSGASVPARMTLQPLVGTPDERFSFVLSVAEDTTTDGDTADGMPLGGLPAVLQRNEREIRAAGLAAWLTALPSALEMPELCLLTAREYEIVLRLVTGRRVAAIAKELFLSPSTVRNHLTTIYRKFGVHSQVELLDRLRRQ